MKTLRYLAVTIMVVAAIVPAVAQKRNINLTIAVKGPNGGPVNGAAVVLKQTDYALSYGNIALNEQGVASLKVYAGNHSLEASARGYDSARKDFNVVADTTVELTLAEQTLTPYSLSTSIAHNPITGLNDLTFTWNQEPPVFWDDFESYDPFAVKWGQWSGIDGDGLNAAALVGSYLNRGGMQYAQIINPLVVQPAWWYDYPILRPYSGKQYVGFTRTESGAQNDDWLITPVITPGNQNIFSFMAKAADVYKEKFQVYVTTVLDNPQKKDFKQLNPGNYETADYKGWVNKKYDLTAYAGKQVRLAIRYISEANNGGAFMLMVDDVYVGQDKSYSAPKRARRVTPQSAGNPNESFNVYLNDALVGTTEDYEWQFNDLEAGTYKLGVQAVYPASTTEVVDTVITISNAAARLEAAITTNNGKNVNGEWISITDEASGEQYEAEIIRGKAVFPSVMKGSYLLGVTIPNYETYSQQLNIDGDMTLNIELKEKIINPYNVTVDSKVTGANANQVTVKWNQNISFTDDFEAYDDFATGRFGNWRTYDMDQHPCYPIGLGSASNIVTFPGASTPGAPCPVPPMIFNPWHTKPAMMPTDPAVMAPSGDKTVIFFSPQNNGANKWLVSPEITIRDNFVCRFAAKAYAEYPESMSVCVFKDGAQNPVTDSWDDVSYINPVSYGVWTLYETDLSAYAGQKVRIGIHYTSFDAFFSQIDNFYVGNLDDEGTTVDVGDVKQYNVKFDNAEVGATTEPAIVLNDVKAGQHTVAIQAQYESGMSQYTTHSFKIDLVGDVNGDKVVDVSDITVLLNVILGKTSGYRPATIGLCDLNGDSTVDTTDLNILVNIILGKV
ncbi:MAG: choice-of-anchor J domain-containing protein [Muribaculaceae bacterium]|nr:choice-of-anchor J domain-containing protein [Muribaculaceae bacterium]